MSSLSSFSVMRQMQWGTDRGRGLGEHTVRESNRHITHTCVMPTITCRVRHEAAEALGAIADTKTVSLLKEFADDFEPIVAHSCVVALDVLEFELSGAMEYADKGQRKACMC